MTPPKLKKTSARGYGAQHQKLRTRWKRLLQQQGDLPCTRCHLPVYPTDAWDLDHTDDRSGYLGIAHTTCNRSAGGRKAHNPKRRSWQW